jgi:hypothetical protein
MATGSTYKKYGFSTPDLSGLVEGQKATGQGFKDALSGVDSLLQEAKKGYAETNTLNMQNYLKNKIKSAGLGGEKIDTTDIKSKFGDLINMKDIDTAISGQTKELEKDAINTASGLAAKTISEGGDALESRRVFEKSLRDAGANDKLIGIASQSYNDANAVKFQDMATLQKRKTEARSNAFLDELATGTERDVAIASLTNDLPKDQLAAEKRRLKGLWESTKDLTQTQRADRKYHMELNNNQGQLKIQRAQSVVDALTDKQVEAQDAGISKNSYALSDSLSQELGSSPVDAIGKQVTNIWESMSSSDDAQELQAMQKELIATGANTDDINAAVVQAYQEDGGSGDALGFKDISGAGMKYILNRSKQLVEATKNATSVNSELSAARLAVSAVSAKVADDATRLRQKLTKAGERSNLGIEGPGINDMATGEFKNRLSAQSQTPAAGTVDPQAVIKPEPDGDANPPPISPKDYLNYGNQVDNREGNSATEFLRRVKAGDASINPPLNAANLIAPDTKTTLGGETVPVGKSPIQQAFVDSKTPEFKKNQIKHMDRKLAQELSKSKSKQRPAEIARLRRLITKFKRDLGGK